MRKYRNETVEKLELLSCNRCGKSIKLVNGMGAEGVCHVEVPWGYFSEMDGEVHSFDLCEECYRKLIKEFAIPVTVRERKELL